MTPALIAGAPFPIPSFVLFSLPLPFLRLPRRLTISDMRTSFFLREIKLILLNEYGVYKVLVRFQFSEQIFTYGIEMVRPVFLMRKTF